MQPKTIIKNLTSVYDIYPQTKRMAVLVAMVLSKLLGHRFAANYSMGCVLGLWLFHWASFNSNIMGDYSVARVTTNFAWLEFMGSGNYLRVFSWRVVQLITTFIYSW